MGQELSWSLCLASTVSSLLTFFANRGSSGAGEEEKRRHPGLPASAPPHRIFLDPWELWSYFLSPRSAGTGTRQALSGLEVTLSTWQVQDSISGDGLKHGPFSLPTALKTVIRCHFPRRPSLSLGAVGIITRPGPLLPCTAPRTDATCVLSTLGVHSHPALKPPDK